jgi:preprotein translocase subunit YajC
MTLLDLIVATEKTTEDTGNGGDGWRGLGSILPFLVLFGLAVYFLMIRPQQKQRREHQAMIDSLRRGDKVVTLGGLHGRIEGLKDKVVVLKVAENVKIEIEKASVARVVSRRDDEETSSLTSE